jgi:hypothetical protein
VLDKEQAFFVDFWRWINVHAPTSAGSDPSWHSPFTFGV